MQQLSFREFRGVLKAWATLFQQAAEFATELGPDRVVSISHSSDDFAGVVVVWFWKDADDQRT